MRRVIVFILAATFLAGTTLRPADCNQNGSDDFGDITSGRSPDCNANGIPDECDIAPVNYGLTRLEHENRTSVSAAVILRDLDEDGRLDLAQVHDILAIPESRISIRWNNGDGTLAPGVDVGAMDVAQALAAVDADGDGDLDLAAAHLFGVSIFQRTAGRAFTLAQMVPLEFDPVSIDAGDLDGDRDLDLVAAGSFRAGILRNDGAGAFVVDRTFPIGSDPVAVIFADLDRDGDVDLVTGNKFENVTVLRNQGAGRFAEPRNFAAGGPVASLLAADLNGDGTLDLAAANETEHVTLLLNPGDATFGDTAPLAVSPRPLAVLAADLDRDGDLDLVASDLTAGVSVLLNHGPARFTRPMIFDPAGSVHSFAAGDLDGDGQLEIAARNGGTLYLLGRQDVALGEDCNRDGVPDDCQLEGNDCDANLVPDDCDLAAVDCNLNAIPDSCETDCNENDLPDDCDLWDGASTDCNANGIPDDCDVAATSFVFRESTAVPGSEFVVRPADLDGDHDQDLAVAAGTKVRLFSNAGGGEFVPLPLIEAGAEFARALTAGDFDGDCDIDLAWAGNGLISLSLNLGGGSFALHATIAFSGTAASMTSADLDADADLDLVVGGVLTGLVVLLNHGGARYGSASNYPMDRGAHFVLAADLDGDSFPELVSNSGVLKNSRDGRFLAPEPLTTATQRAWTAVAADFNGDGEIDLAASLPFDKRIAVLLNEGGGRFPLAFNQYLESNPTILSAGDLDRDGDIDLAVGVTRSPFGSDLLALLNEGDGRSYVFRLVSPLERDQLHDLISFDVEGDADPDLALMRQSGSLQSLHCLVNESIPPVSRDRNHNRVPDDCERALFHRGDPTADGTIDLSDPVAVLSFLFLGGERPGCLEAADGDNDGKVELMDGLFLFHYLFFGGPPPAAPGPVRLPCGADPDSPGSRGDLGCSGYPPCE
jgi:hypothetical protein